jgi:hypothetical protein
VRTYKFVKLLGKSFAGVCVWTERWKAICKEKGSIFKTFICGCLTCPSIVRLISFYFSITDCLIGEHHKKYKSAWQRLVQTPLTNNLLMKI